MEEKNLGAPAGLTLVDADVLIDLQRGHQPARKWIEEIGEAEFAIPGVVMLELLIGSRNSPELNRSIVFVEQFRSLWLTEDDNKLARQLIEKYRLSTGLDLGDYLIAAQALNRNATLLTFNLKHFRSIPDLDAQAPYTR